MIRASEKQKYHLLLDFAGCVDSQSRSLIKRHSFHGIVRQQITVKVMFRKSTIATI